MLPRDDESTQIDDIAGSFVGEYQVEGLLGEGGMGRVYAAVHPVIAKRAAVKVLRLELSKNREAVQRFVQEARAVNQIGHPNIVDIFAFGTLPDGRCYYVMELLRGESLRSRIRGGPLELADALSILDTISIALEAAHEKAIVHRDLKPDNVFLVDIKSDRPTVKLLDFGIAKLLSDDLRIDRTRTGNLLGTPAYISPEQARGHPVDHRTDVYALGALAFELVTGRLPFPADNAADMIAMHLVHAPPSARALVPVVPPLLDDLIGRLMAKDPAQRPSLAIAREQLRLTRGQVGYGVFAGQPISDTGIATVPDATPPSYAMRPNIGGATWPDPPPSRSRPHWWILIGAVLAIVAGVGVFFAVRGLDEPAPSAPVSSSPTPVPSPPAPTAPPPPAPAPSPPPPATTIEELKPAETVVDEPRPTVTPKAKRSTAPKPKTSPPRKTPTLSGDDLPM